MRPGSLKTYSLYSVNFRAFSKDKALIILVLLFIFFAYTVMIKQSDQSADVVTFVVVAAGEINQLSSTIYSLLQSNNMKRGSNFIVVYDGSMTAQVSRFLKTQSAIINAQVPFQFITTESIIGEIACIDLAFSKVQTKYAFLSLGHWKYQGKNFLTSALDIMKKNKRISQVTVSEVPGIWQTKMEAISDLDSIIYGFNLLPSLHRMKAYKHFRGGFVNFTFNATFGSEAGAAQALISQAYLDMNYHVRVLKQPFAFKNQANNFFYPVFEYRDQYSYLGTWKVQEEDKNVCRLMLNIGGSLKIRKKRVRVTRKLVNQLIKVQKSQIRTQYQKYGVATSIQIASSLDYLNLIDRKEYKYISQTYPKTLLYQAKYYKSPKKSEAVFNNHAPRKINSTQSFNQLLDKNNTSAPSKRTKREDALKLAALLIQSPKDSIRQQAEEYFYQKQNIKVLSTAEEESRICLFLTGKHLISRINFLRLLESIDRQDYFNYQFVVSVDDNSDFSLNKIYDYTRGYYPRLINRLKIALQNEERLGNAGNHFLRMKQFCRGSQIVISLNGNSSFVGRKSLKVVNHFFKDANNWLTFFSPVISQNQNLSFLNMNIKYKNLRLIGASTDQYLVAFRFGLGDLLPLSQVLEFKYNKENGQLRPGFIQTESNSFYTYSFSQMSGPQRIRYVDEYPIYLYNPIQKSQKGCNELKAIWENAKAELKYPLNRLKSLNDSPTLNISYEVSSQTLRKIQHLYEKSIKCSQGQDNTIRTVQFSVLLEKSLSRMVSPDYYLPTNEIIQLQQMPFCFITEVFSKEGKEGERDFLQISQSIQNQNYSNYTLLVIQRINSSNFELQARKEGWVQTLHASLPNSSYQSYKTVLKKLCTPNSLVMFLNDPLKPNKIKDLNNIHQKQNIWMTYSIRQNFIQITTAYLRVFQLIQLNDFDESNRKYLLEGDQQLMALILLELCPKFSSRHDFLTIYESGTSTYRKQVEYLRAFTTNKQLYERSSYQYLLNLEQDHQVDLGRLEIDKKKFQQGCVGGSKPLPNSFLRKIDFLKAIEYEQIPYIPDNHFLNFRQFSQLNRRYNLSQFIGNPLKQVRFCLTIFGRNNTELGRYWKILQSIKMQDYENYHIVFLDDNSDDKTLQLSMQYLSKLNFPKQKLTFIKNSKRMYATYNIINAAFNYCHEEDIQVRFDGDDVMLGRNIFNLFNTFYQRNPELWLVYTNFKSSEFVYGLGLNFNQSQQLMNCLGTFRRTIHFITPLTTWRVKLIRSIPLKYHYRDPGLWFNTLYDDALQFSFVELATLSRIQYIPYINYHYNANYGSNDNSNQQKTSDRTFLLRQVIYYDPIHLPLKGLDDPRTKNPEIVAELLKNKKDKVFIEVKY